MEDIKVQSLDPLKFFFSCRRNVQVLFDIICINDNVFIDNLLSADTNVILWKSTLALEPIIN